ncbi:atlastin [Folsomia candida]|uniref:Atlastin n=1 Tax=Folsomia candida TaxID=158441 RepID=A0A226D4P6_FOLCA|nr:atlastin [Folsomia candida]XP_021965639.1 atlastin [Folsomia candida]OXA40209.1 Atlastin [Folsomia candida]
MAHASKGEPISILKIAEDKVTIDVNAIKSIFEKIGNCYFAIYSINGPKRTGKSYMLSNFIRYLNQQSTSKHHGNDWVLNSGNIHTFPWRGGDDRQTIGIDVWSEPFWTTQNGRRVAIILMDTQGSFDDKTTLQQNAIIFAISTLLSSVLIFNIMRDVGEDVLQFFQFFSSFATLTIPEVEGATGDRGAGAFQKLIFLIRDFQFVQDYEFGYYDDKHVPQGQEVRGKNYKKEKLDSKSNQPTEVRFTHDQVVKSYQDVGVYLMPEPDKGLKQRDKVDNLDPEFSQHIGLFVPLMLSPGHLVTKKMGGVEVTGSEMIKYVTSWATLFEGDDLPEIKSVYHSAAESQFIIAKHLALTFYATEMQTFMRKNSDGVGDSLLSMTHANLVTESFAIYKSKSKLGGANSDAKFKEEFTTESVRLFDTFRSINHANLTASKTREELKETQARFERDMRAQERRTREREEAQAKQRAKMEADIAAGMKKNEDLRDVLEEQKKEREREREEAKKKEAEFEKRLASVATNQQPSFVDMLPGILGGLASVLIPGLGAMARRR